MNSANSTADKQSGQFHGPETQTAGAANLTDLNFSGQNRESLLDFFGAIIVKEKIMG